MNDPRTCLPFPDLKPDATLDLFCLTYAGGSSAIYREWAQLFPSWISVRPVEYPGRGTRMGEQLEGDPARLVEDLVAQLQPQLKRPFAIFGHSLGAAIGYRMTLSLQQQTGPLAFFPSGRHSPDSDEPVPQRAHLDDENLLAEVRALNGSPSEILENRELMSLLLPIIRNDFRLSETIRAERDIRRLNCPVHAFGGLHDWEVPSEAISQWRTVAAGPFSATMLDGDHFYVHHTQHVEAIAECISEVLMPLVSGQTGTRRSA